MNGLNFLSLAFLGWLRLGQSVVIVSPGMPYDETATCEPLNWDGGANIHSTLENTTCLHGPWDYYSTTEANLDFQVTEDNTTVIISLYLWSWCYISPEDMFEFYIDDIYLGYAARDNNTMDCYPFMEMGYDSSESWQNETCLKYVHALNCASFVSDLPTVELALANTTYTFSIRFVSNDSNFTYAGSEWGFSHFMLQTEETLPPTTFPSAMPSENPTGIPSLSPSMFPTINPTMLPSEMPSIYPSVIPTVNPSSFPSMFPSRMPSQQTTSNNPTMNPTMIPSSDPSMMPSTFPSMMPSVTNQPAMPPVGAGTDAPTSSPVEEMSTTEEEEKEPTGLKFGNYTLSYLYAGLGAVVLVVLCLVCVSCGYWIRRRRGKYSHLAGASTQEHKMAEMMRTASAGSAREAGYAPKFGKPRRGTSEGAGSTTGGREFVIPTGNIGQTLDARTVVESPRFGTAYRD